MDITPLFKASVKTVRTRNKALGTGQESTKNLIFKSSRPKTEFSTKSKEMVVAITKLKDFLIKYRKDYINPSSHLKSDASSMTEADRDKIDADAQVFMKTCLDAIRSFKQEAMKQELTEEVKMHREATFELLDSYLKGVCKLYSEQRALRVKKVVDKKRISRLESLKLKNSKANFTSSFDSRNKLTSSKAESANEVNEDYSESGLSPEEIEMFQQENQMMLQERNNLDEVRELESKVVDIAALQTVFMDEVVKQDEVIEQVREKAVTSTENIEGATEAIREAIKNNASLRVWVLFFLFMCSFTLLFLDWYN
ncbi:syntaxin-18-like [Anneissia japonica]|uniref:syntaxin-18-like n=1 Tax=Anneissia japonica TaxID=1529436 RepID=UPI0014258523|nr:syntaxin-18-like [Anneissia japonica]